MNRNGYFVIHCNEDGETFVEPLTADELKKRLAEDYWGENPEIADSIPRANTAYWHGRLVIIRGEIFVPKAVQRVTEWDVP
jgi:hypothetical protein